MQLIARIVDVGLSWEFGGGGHSLAAGIRMSGPMPVAKAKVLPALGEAMAEDL